MKIKYTVMGVSTDAVEVDAMVGDTPVKAKIDATVVEMQSADGSMGHTFRFHGHAPEDAEMFVVGAEIEVTFAPAE